MDPITIALLLGGAASSSLNNLMGIGANYAMQKDAQGFNAQQAALARSFAHGEADLARSFAHDEASLQRDWSKEMASTAYQREVADMKAAGINPALLMKGATPVSSAGAAAAGTPGVQSAQANSGINQVASVGGTISQLFNTALKATLAKENDTFGNELAAAALEEKKTNTALKKAQLFQAERMNKIYQDFDSSPKNDLAGVDWLNS